MPGQLRPNMKLAKIVYKLLKTPKDQQQKAHPQASDKHIRQWKKDSQPNA